MQNAQDEYTLKKSKAVAPIFHAAGAALYECQNFELTLAAYLHCLSFLEGSRLTPQDTTDVLDDKKKKTAGQLINDLKEHVQLSGGISAIIEEAKGARNKLAHRYLVENVSRFYSVQGRAEVIQEIRQLTSKIIYANALLAPFIQVVSEDLHGDRFKKMRAEFEKKFEED